MSITLHRIRNARDTTMVPMNSIRSGPWSSSLQYLTTEELNGCTAVAITSPYGGLLAHIAPRSSFTNDGDTNVRNLMQQVITHFNRGRGQGFFIPATSSAVILAANYRGELALPDAVGIVRYVLGELGVRVEVGEYQVRGVEESRVRGYTSVIIQGRVGRTVRIYINDRPTEFGGGGGTGRMSGLRSGIGGGLSSYGHGSGLVQGSRSGMVNEMGGGITGRGPTRSMAEHSRSSMGANRSAIPQDRPTMGYRSNAASDPRSTTIAARVRQARDIGGSLVRQGHSAARAAQYVEQALTRSLGISQQQACQLLFEDVNRR